MTHYNNEFFEWQRKIGEFGGIVDLYKFKNFVKPSDRVIDFGCGGGFILKLLNCSDKIGIEINNVARHFAHENGINTVNDISEIKNEWADVIISDNALEHTFSPYDVLINLFSKLKPGGKIILVVPQEKQIQWKPNDINQHLYTWNPMCIGNLFVAAGFIVKEIEVLPLWPPKARIIWKYFGSHIFFLASKLYTSFFTKWSQIRIVAIKPN